MHFFYHVLCVYLDRVYVLLYSSIITNAIIYFFYIDFVIFSIFLMVPFKNYENKCIKLVINTILKF